MKAASDTVYHIRKQFREILVDGSVLYYDVKVRYVVPRSKKEKENNKAEAAAARKAAAVAKKAAAAAAAAVAAATPATI